MKLLVRQFFFLLFIPFVLILIIGTFYNINTSYELSRISSYIHGSYAAIQESKDITKHLSHDIFNCISLLINDNVSNDEWTKKFVDLKNKKIDSDLLNKQITEIEDLLDMLYKYKIENNSDSHKKIDDIIDKLFYKIHNISENQLANENIIKSVDDLSKKSYALGNNLLYATICFIILTFILYFLLVRYLGQPLNKFSIYIKKIGQVKNKNSLPQLPNSAIKEINEISDSLSNLGDYLDIATKKSIKIEKKATIDGLTKLFNRRTFDEKLVALWEEAKVKQSSISLIMLDVDKFKIYNDCCGHQAGDDCLRIVASALARGVRKGVDFCARYGGEEFVVVLPDTTGEGALTVANRIHTTLAGEHLEHPNSPTGKYVTVSLGIAAISPAETDEPPTKLVACADEALYFTKENGRNGSTIYPPKKRVPAPKLDAADGQ